MRSPVLAAALILIMVMGPFFPARAQMDPCSNPYAPCPSNLYNPVSPSQMWNQNLQRAREEGGAAQDDGASPAPDTEGVPVETRPVPPIREQIPQEGVDPLRMPSAPAGRRNDYM